MRLFLVGIIRNKYIRDVKVISQCAYRGLGFLFVEIVESKGTFPKI